MRVLIFHGYLLGGTGSNVYTARLAEALVGLGHEVHLLSQDRHPESHPFIDAVCDWDEGAMRAEIPARRLGERSRGDRAGSCTVYRPNIGGLLPVYVADRYEGIEARTFAQCSDEEISRYIDGNVTAVEDVLERARPEIALANHLVMGPAILARGLRGEVPYAVKIHGSALEYTVKADPGRFLGFAREGLAEARTVLVGSRHTARSLWEALGREGLSERTRLGPPGVDVDRFTPREHDSAATGVRALAARMRTADGGHEPAQEESAFARDAFAAGEALARLRPEDDRLVAYVGKLIVSKGVDLLIAAWPLVLETAPAARLVVVGFGAYREGLQRLCAALAGGDLEEARSIALAGRAIETSAVESHPLSYLIAFLESLRGAERESYLLAAAGLAENVVFAGRLEHDELAELLPACEALVVPSTFPEAFGMVAAEGAACGVLPVSAEHSGLAEVSDVLAGGVPDAAAAWLSFSLGAGAVRSLAACVAGWLDADEDLRAQTRSGLVRTVREQWSWDGVARGVIAAARGESDSLRRP